MPKWKLQATEPDTCDPPGCRYIEMYDVLDSPPHTLTIVAFERVCPGHIAPIPVGKMLWHSGNWKDIKKFIAYQKQWFMRQNHVRWLEEHPDEVMPPQIRSLTSDPISPGSVSIPPQVEIDGMNQAHSQNLEHNIWKNQTVKAITDEGIDRDGISWSWTGVGNARVLTVIASNLTGAQLNSVRAKVDIQFGPGKITIEK